MIRQKQPQARHNRRKADSTSIRKGISRLPLKSLHYAISYLMLDPCSAKARSGTSEARRLATIARHKAAIESILSDASDSHTKEAIHSKITSAANSYVGFFYSIDEAARKAFIDRADKSTMSDRIPKKNNLILIPAIMASRGERRSRAMAQLLRWLYSAPLVFLQKSSKTAMHIELLQQSIGLKDIADSSMKRLSLTMNQLDSAIERIMGGGFRFEEDSMLADIAVNEIVAISEAERLSIADFISEKLYASELYGDKAVRMIRK